MRVGPECPGLVESGPAGLEQPIEVSRLSFRRGTLKPSALKIGHLAWSCGCDLSLDDLCDSHSRDAGLHLSIEVDFHILGIDLDDQRKSDRWQPVLK